MKELKKSDPNSKVLAVTYVCVALFLALAVYMGYFLQVKSEDVINNPYNARLDSFSDRIVRGSILAADGTVLAETTTDDGGNETRVYNYGSVFDHAVGYSSKGKTGIEAMANFYLLSSHVNLVEQAGNELAGAKNLGDSDYSGYGAAADGLCGFRRQKRGGDRHGAGYRKDLSNGFKAGIRSQYPSSGLDGSHRQL